MAVALVGTSSAEDAGVGIDPEVGLGLSAEPGGVRLVIDASPAAAVSEEALLTHGCQVMLVMTAAVTNTIAAPYDHGRGMVSRRAWFSLEG